MLPSSMSVDTSAEPMPTSAGANSRAATTQYSRPTSDDSAELDTRAMPSRWTGRPTNHRIRDRDAGTDDSSDAIAPTLTAFRPSSCRVRVMFRASSTAPGKVSARCPPIPSQERWEQSVPAAG
jgi:hypothetical protein